MYSAFAKERLAWHVHVIDEKPMVDDSPLPPISDLQTKLMIRGAQLYEPRRSPDQTDRELDDLDMKIRE